MVRVAIDGVPTAGKSSVIEALPSRYDCVPELPAFLPDRVRSYPESTGEYEDRVIAEFGNMAYRADRYATSGDVALDTSVAGTVALASLFGELLGATDPASPVVTGFEKFREDLLFPDVFVFLTADPETVQLRWQERSHTSSFWSDPAVVSYLNDFFIALSDRVPSCVVDTSTSDPDTVTSTIEQTIAGGEEPDIERGAFVDSVRAETPTLDWSLLECSRYENSSA